ncbi:hypothetical protein CHS0354_038043 [Potamilus streckersoni]|uniref:Uncharacterized protein n=1 Tax=Potamilus streckersoni TaxID=2493646 RepID=A0AAE0SST8_9BIVA|nr:hypothetical protein CHS0354_038043 [Potamilus streckersoni]
MPQFVLSENKTTVPVIKEDNSVKKTTKFKLKERWKQRLLERERLNENRGPRIKELVCEDVYLMDNKHRRFDKNLLTNSLAARLKQSLPGDVNVTSTVLNKLKRESLKDYMHLANLQRQYSTEMNLESNRLDSESFKVLKRHNHLLKQSEWQRKKQEKIEAQMRAKSSTSSRDSSSSLPRISVGNQPEETKHTDSLPSAPSSANRRKGRQKNLEDFAFIDVDDNSHVKVFKKGGIFRPQNKYFSKVEIMEKRQIPCFPEKALAEYKTATTEESESPQPSKSQSRKGLRVTWSSQSKYLGETPETIPSSEAREVSDELTTRTLTTAKSSKSDSVLWRKPLYTNGRSKIETIGIQWKLPLGAKPEKLAKPNSGGQHSRNLLPVSMGLQREGTSVSQTRWHVQRMQSLNTYDMYKVWLEKLEVLKNPNYTPDLQPERSNTLANFVATGRQKVIVDT